MEERLDRLEAMMTQLITSVANIMESQTEMQNDIITLKEKQDDMQKKNDERHREIMDQFSLFRRDQAVAWE